jgi:ribosomal protein L37AE/L43A
VTTDKSSLTGCTDALRASLISSINYWQKHKTHKCNKCKEKGHVARDCTKICRSCGNLHPGNMCAFKLESLLSSIENKIKKICSEDKRLQAVLYLNNKLETAVTKNNKVENFTPVTIDTIQLQYDDNEEIIAQKDEIHASNYIYSQFDKLLIDLSTDRQIGILKDHIKIQENIISDNQRIINKINKNNFFQNLFNEHGPLYYQKFIDEANNKKQMALKQICSLKEQCAQQRYAISKNTEKISGYGVYTITQNKVYNFDYKRVITKKMEIKSQTTVFLEFVKNEKSLENKINNRKKQLRQLEEKIKLINQEKEKIMTEIMSKANKMTAVLKKFKKNCKR